MCDRSFPFAKGKSSEQEKENSPSGILSKLVNCYAVSTELFLEVAQNRVTVYVTSCCCVIVKPQIFMGEGWRVSAN